MKLFIIWGADQFKIMDADGSFKKRRDPDHNNLAVHEAD